MSRRRGPASIRAEVDHGVAELVPDADRPGGWTLLVDGTPQSYVDIDDPLRLEFEYIRRLASVIDAVGEPGGPLRVLHLGGGGLTLARYVAATRPGSTQWVVERDAALIELVRRELPLPRGATIRVRAADARAAVESAGAGRYDLVLADVYGGARIPGRLSTVEYVGAVARTLRPGGVYAVNLADGPPLGYLRGQLATVRQRFSEVCVAAEVSVLKGRRFGNLVVVAAAAAADLPVTELARAAARDPFPSRILHGADLDRFVAGARPVTDDTAVASPAPPPKLFG